MLRINNPKKKALGVFGALLVIILLLPLFAAFEAHVINVKARIESTLGVTGMPTDFGSVFSHESFESSFTVALSDSMLQESYTVNLDYRIIQEPAAPTNTSPPVTYEDLRPYIYVKSDPADHDQDSETSASLSNHLPDTSDTWLVSLYVPCISSGQCVGHGTPECSAFPCGGPRYSSCQTILENPPGSGGAGDWATDVWVEVQDYSLNDYGEMGSCGNCHEPDAMCVICHKVGPLP